MCNYSNFSQTEIANVQKSQAYIHKVNELGVTTPNGCLGDPLNVNEVI